MPLSVFCLHEIIRVLRHSAGRFIVNDRAYIHGANLLYACYTLRCNPSEATKANRHFVFSRLYFLRLMLFIFSRPDQIFCSRGCAENKKLCSPFLRETVCEMRGPMRGRGRGRGMGPGMWGPPRGRQLVCT